MIRGPGARVARPGTPGTSVADPPISLRGETSQAEVARRPRFEHAGPGHHTVEGGARDATRCHGGGWRWWSWAPASAWPAVAGRQRGWQPHRYQDRWSHRALLEHRHDPAGHARRLGPRQRPRRPSSARHPVPTTVSTPQTTVTTTRPRTDDDRDRTDRDGHRADQDGDRAGPDGHGRPDRHGDHRHHDLIEPSRSGGCGRRCRCGGRNCRFTVRGFGERAGLGLGTDWRMRGWRRGRAGRVHTWPT